MLSVCVTTYNHVNFIEQCLDSILNQKVNFNYEIVLGEDESSDGTREICIDYAAKHPDLIRLFKRRRADVIKIGNRATGRFNWLENIKAARGKYIALLDGDDYWSDVSKLQKQVDFLEANPSYSLVFSNGKVVYEASEKAEHMIYMNEKRPDGYYQPISIPEDSTDIMKLSKGNFIHTAGVVFRNWVKEDGIPEYLYHTSIGDWPLHLYTARIGLIKFMNEDFIRYRVHDKGVYSKRREVDKFKMGLGQIAPMLKVNPFSPEVTGNIHEYTLRCVDRYLHVSDDFQADPFLSDFMESLDDKSENLKKNIKEKINNFKSSYKIDLTTFKKLLKSLSDAFKNIGTQNSKP